MRNQSFKRGTEVYVISGDNRNLKDTKIVEKGFKDDYVYLKGLCGLNSKKKSYPLKIHISNLKIKNLK